MITGIIVDDEKHSGEVLFRLLKPYSKRLLIRAIINNAETAIEYIQQNAPDVVFLDVQLNNDMTAFDLLRAVRPVNFHVIFITAFHAYAVQAFRFNAIDYLMKPIDEDDLAESIKRLFDKTKRKERTSTNPELNNLLDQQHYINKQHKISIPTLEGFIFIPVGNIVRCQSDTNYTIVFIADRRTYTVSKTLKYFEDLLSPFGFFRIHNSHLVNMDYIETYRKGKGGSITLSDKTEIEVSARRKEEFIKAIKSHT
ncbi:LytR/AlgR family response regulator transcription factor [Sphingobacterium sp. LRF_L2]|uniref:LytR/AlgR family response regulator transcription factor n=1 Tax=Sphingobacterium sp. LRF_L2 TaxID=3369421 RepID=UPI003F64128D